MVLTSSPQSLLVPAHPVLESAAGRGRCVAETRVQHQGVIAAQRNDLRGGVSVLQIVAERLGTPTPG